jgi:hypothetical protein
VASISASLFKVLDLAGMSHFDLMMRFKPSLSMFLF